MMVALFCWIPTILFFIIVLWGFLLGLARGFRKSIILLIQAAIAFAIALTFYLIAVNVSESDVWIVQIVNNFAGDNGLQNALGVSSECKGLNEILTQFIINKMSYGNGLTLALKENANYLSTLVSFAYHIVFFFIALFVYDVLLFLFYLIYVIFYPERRHREKLQKKELDLDSDVKYKKRSLLGGLIGGLRGLVVGIIVISFVGATLFMVGGGIGEKKYEEYTFGDPTRQRIFEVYEAMGSYGNHGIIKVLNTFKDKNEIPYYYFAANLVLAGKLDDPDLGINQNIHFAEEIGLYTRFARDTFDLMFEIDKDTMIKVVNGEVEKPDEVIYGIMAKPEFKEKFTKLIDEFDSGVYFYNFAISMLDSISYHIDEIAFNNDVDSKSVELIKILLKDDYYSSYIPDDSKAKSKGEKVPTIKLSNLLNKNDVKILLGSVFDFLSVRSTDTETNKLIVFAKKFAPEIKKLSALQDARKNELNPVFERAFVAIDNMYQVQEEQLTVEKLELMVEQNVTVDWVEEIKNLLDIIVDVGTLVGNVYKPGEGLLTTLFNIFDSERQDYNENVSAYTNIQTKIEQSPVIDKILSISIVFNGFKNVLKTIYSDIYIPDDIVFVNRKNGDEVIYGELHQFLSVFRLFLENRTNAEIVPKLIGDSDLSVVDKLLLLADLSVELAEENDDGKSLLDYCADSKIMQILLSSIILKYQNMDIIQLYIPKSVYVTVGGEQKNLIQNEELSDLLSTIPMLFDDVIPYLDEESEHQGDLDYLFDSIASHKTDLLASDIVEGTLSNVVKNILSKVSMFVIPKSLDNIEDWLTTDTEDGELLKLIDAKLSFGLSLTDFVANGFSGNFSEHIGGLNGEYFGSGETKLHVALKSKVMHATLTNGIDTLMKDDIVKPEAKNATKYIEDGNSYYYEAELKSLVDVINQFALDLTNINISSITDNLDSLNDDSIIDGKSKLDLMYDSVIVKSMLHDNIEKIINSNDVLVDHPNASEVIYNNVKIYKKAEILALVDFISEIGGTISEVELSNITFGNQILDDIEASEILSASVSKSIIDKDMIVILAKDYDTTNNYIKKNELRLFIEAVRDGLDVVNAGELTTDTISVPNSDDKIDVLLNSSIMTATISSKISFGSNPVYVSTLKSSLETRYTDNNNQVVVDNNELKLFIKGIRLLSTTGDYNVTLDQSHLKNVYDSGKLPSVLESNILHIMISDFLYPTKQATDIEENIEVYNIQNTALGDKPILTAVTITAKVASFS